MAGELDNRTSGKVTGWMRFLRNGKLPLRVTFDLAGDFHEDIRGTVIKLSNPKPSDEYLDEGKTYMEGFSRVQRGTVGDITAGLALGPWTEDLARNLMERNELYWSERKIQGSEREVRRREFSEQYRAHIAARDLYYPYTDYPYIEWYSDNGRVVLELDPSQVEIVKADSRPKEKTPSDLRRKVQSCAWPRCPLSAVDIHCGPDIGVAHKLLLHLHWSAGFVRKVWRKVPAYPSDPRNGYLAGASRRCWTPQERQGTLPAL